MGCKAGRCKTSSPLGVFIVIASPEGWSTKAKEAPSPHEVRMYLLDTNPVFQSVGGKYCAGVFVELKKAFDTVDHSILLRKLDYYGIRGIANEWFCSYLKKRKQFVSMKNNMSSIKEILTGVPQG